MSKLYSSNDDANLDNPASLILSTESNNQQNIVPFTKMPAPKIVTVPHFGFITAEKLVRIAPNAAVWGAAAGAAVLLLGSDIPIIKRDILSKVPVFGNYWAVEAPAKEED